jgi:hypothetical protein
MVGREGIEPSYPCGSGILSPLRIPFRHLPSEGRKEGMPKRGEWQSLDPAA